MLQLLGNISEKMLLDVGCGTGHTLYAMAKHGAKIYEVNRAVLDGFIKADR